MNSVFVRALLFVLLLGGGSACFAVQSAATVPDFQTLEARDTRVATIAHRLAVANVGLCRARQWRHGLVFIDLANVASEYRAVVSRVFAVESGLGIAAVVPDGPGARAGLRPGDIILSADRVALASVPRGSVESELAVIDAAFADGVAEFVVRRAGTEVVATVRAQEGCASRVEVTRSHGRQGAADGNVIHVTAGLVDFATDDAELAAVIAHELAHNILGHRARLDAARVSRGFFGNFGRNAARIRETEIEADRFSIYLLDRAGYDPAAAIRFWTRFGQSGLNFLGSPTHPNWRSRIALFEREIEAIRRARAEGREPIPPFGPPPG